MSAAQKPGSRVAISSLVTTKRRHDLFGEQAESFAVIQSGAAHGDDEVGHAHVNVSLELLADRGWIAQQNSLARLFHTETPQLSDLLQEALRLSRVRLDVEWGQVGPLDLCTVATDLATVLFQHLVLGGDLVWRQVADIPHLRIAGDQREDALLTDTADHDRRVWPLQRLGHERRIDQRVVVPLE